MTGGCDRSKHAISCRVAVLGAGAAGIAAAKELRAEGHTVHVLEQASTLGGTWVQDENTESDLLGQDPQRSVVHSSMYSSLRTNLPREVMSFYDYPFTPQLMKGQSRDGRRFPHHSEVLSYLHVYANHFNVKPHIQFNTRVLSVAPVVEKGASQMKIDKGPTATKPAFAAVAPSKSCASAEGKCVSVEDEEMHRVCTRTGTKWKVTTTTSKTRQAQSSDENIQEATYDAVLVCSGHYSAPRIPEVKGLDLFPGRCEHSHNYRSGHKYSGQRVLVVGAHASGVDISCEVGRHAAEVHFSAATWRYDAPDTQLGGLGECSNIYKCGWLQELTGAGDAILQDGTRITAIDVVIFCTGYHFSFPFLQDGLLGTCRDYMHPLFQHMMTPTYGPSLSFIGMPLLVAPFLMFSLQSMYIARMLSGKVQPPHTADMHTWIHEHCTKALAAGVKPRHIHVLSKSQWEYLHWIADQAGVPRVPSWRQQLWDDTLRYKSKHFGDAYRDEWDADMLHSESIKDALEWIHVFMDPSCTTPTGVDLCIRSA